MTADAAARSRIADPGLAPVGEQRIAWVARHSPVLNRLARDRLADGALAGRRVAVVVHLEAKTAYLALLLAEAGAEVVAAGSNARSTQDAVCAALVRRGIEVHARHGATPEEFTADLLAVAEGLGTADVVIRATGGTDALPSSAFGFLKDRVVLANAGHQDREIDVEALGPGEEVRPGLTRHDVGGRRAYLCVGGSLVNIAG